MRKQQIWDLNPGKKFAVLQLVVAATWQRKQFTATCAELLRNRGTRFVTDLGHDEAGMVEPEFILRSLIHRLFQGENAAALPNATTN